MYQMTNGNDKIETKEKKSKKHKKEKKQKTKNLAKRLKKEAKKLEKEKQEEKKKRHERDDDEYNMTGDDDGVVNNKPKRQRLSKQHDKGGSNNGNALLLECAMNATFTGSVIILSSSSNDESSISSESQSATTTIPMISTSCNLSRPPESAEQINQQQQQQQQQHPIRYLPIRIQPLLILDINGFLCKCIRHPNKTNYREPSIVAKDGRNESGNIRLVPRVTGTETILRFLDRHFTLAVWTAASERNYKMLAKALFPKEVKSRLLFEWTNDKCKKMHPPQGKPFFVKPINKVWMKYPLWNHTNSFIIFDCPRNSQTKMERTNNALNSFHPPELNGMAVSSDQQANDLANERKQRHFFEMFVDWCQRRCLEDVGVDFLAKALKECQAQSIMGWSYNG